MQKLFLVTSILLSFFLFSCEENGLTEAPEVDPPLEVLNYDGPNQDAPELPSGQDLEGAVLFPASVASAFEGSEMIRVQYYIQEKPSAATLKIYSKSNNGLPGDLVYSAALSSELSANSWNEHFIASPIRIDRDDIWIAIRFNHVVDQRTLGCDQGPAINNGDWIFLDGEWSPLSAISSVNINWNIRVVIDPS